MGYCAATLCSACCWTRARTLSSLSYGRSRGSSICFRKRSTSRQRRYNGNDLSAWRMKSPSAVKRSRMLRLTCSIRVSQTWKGETPFIMKCFAPSVLPRTHGVITKSTSAVMKHIFTTFALSTVLFGISSALVCPSWSITARRTMPQHSTASTMMNALRKSSSLIPSATTATAIRPTMPTSFPMCRGRCRTALSLSVRSM